MKLRFGKVLKRIMVEVLAVSVAISFCKVEVSAAEAEDVEELKFTITEIVNDSGISTIEAGFMNTSITIGRVSTGMDITIMCVMTEDVSKVGIKDIKVKHKVGIFWPVVASSDGAELENASGIGYQTVYEGAIVGDTYKVSCVFYAEYDGKYVEAKGETDPITFNFPITGSSAYTVTF